MVLKVFNGIGKCVRLCIVLTARYKLNTTDWLSLNSEHDMVIRYDCWNENKNYYY